ncbi:MAG: YfbM family protein [Candidatus Thiodiazotropha sp. (ex Dulcina madagascariensis)]|nr:YfbM family protein [Candidatus Thiodiazotropha sp. (ex Dulcina madagascariensis)]
MGMCLALHSVSDRNIERILESPPLIWRLVAQDDPEIYLETVNKSKKGIFSKIFGKKNTDSNQEIPNLEFVEGENTEDDLDKSWQGIHYCLNKTDYEADPPMDFITAGGITAGDIEVGYGPARLFDSNAVKEIEKRLSKVTSEHLRKNYNPTDMEKLDIYPNIWERDGEKGFEYIAEYYVTLKSFISNCSKHNLGMAVYLC